MKKQAKFLNPIVLLSALTIIRDNGDLAAAGFSAHHVRQLGPKGVSGGPFGPGAGLGLIDMVPAPRAEGVKGRLPLVPVLNDAGKKFIADAEKAEKAKARGVALAAANAAKRAKKAADQAPVEEEVLQAA